MRRLAPALILALAACSTGSTTGDYPALLPTEDLLREPALPPHAAADPDAVAAELDADRGRLQRAAAEAAAPTAPGLAARGAALRDRAAAINAAACAETPTAPGCEDN